MKCPACNAEISVYRNPVPTVDIIIEIEGQIVLVERKNPPFGWALPGGFVDYGESFEDAAVREAKEETGLKITGLRQLKTYSAPGRDARLHTASTVFIAKAEGLPVAGDDAKSAALFSGGSLPELVFDHHEIISDYYKFRQTGRVRGRC
ncbi:MAG: NUDIX hydrolase [Deltaproteobacteria bacterium]|nr:MAG: NUDIX hydrolase [Deltaproteobacteria bacterium]